MKAVHRNSAFRKIYLDPSNKGTGHIDHYLDHIISAATMLFKKSLEARKYFFALARHRKNKWFFLPAIRDPGLTATEVGKHLGLSKSVVSRATNRGRKLIPDQPRLPFSLAEWGLRIVN